MKQDRFLNAILIGIGILIASAVLVFFTRQQPLEYGQEDTPEGVIRNYILALQKEDFKRAYSYLKDDLEKPTQSEFQQMLINMSAEIRNTGIQMGETNQFDNDASVAITILHSNNAPFDRGWDENTSAFLVLQNEQWKISNMPYPFWGWDWYVEK